VSYIVLAIPVFFGMILVEVVAAWWQRRGDVYRLDDSVGDLSCGIVDQLLDAFTKTALFWGYLTLYERARAFTIPFAAWSWAACFLGVDFLYYWFHRKSHEVNAFWAAHVVHHQSEEYNLTVALRQGAFQGAVSWAFYLPLALLGFPPAMFLTCASLNTLYQFWIHTRLVGRLGPLEAVLSTPSNHRVHHGRNPKYIDRNHGGVLIVWDRIFGTYAAEEEEPVYGITTPLRSFNPVWANLAYWVELANRAARAARSSDALRYLAARPGWNPKELGGFVGAPEVDRASYRKFEVDNPKGLEAYVLAQFVPALLGTWALLSVQDRLPRAELVAWSALIVVSLGCCAGLLEHRRWALALECARVPALALVAAVALPAADPAAYLGLALAAAALLAWLLRYRELFGAREQPERVTSESPAA
jgi:alkylglycerol monooxygenase